MSSDLSPTLHPQVRITHGEITALVDEGIADLIVAMWRAGIETVLSCQENQPGVAWVEIPFYAFGQFLRVVLSGGPGADGLYWRVLSRYETSGEGDWEYSLFVEDLATDDFIKGDTHHWRDSGIALPFPLIGIRFPVTDIPAIINRLNARKRPAIPIPTGDEKRGYAVLDRVEGPTARSSGAATSPVCEGRPC